MSGIFVKRLFDKIRASEHVQLKLTQLQGRFLISFIPGTLKAIKDSKQFKPDIIEGEYVPTGGLVAAITKIFNPKSKLVISARGNDINTFPNKSFAHKILIKTILKSSDKIVCVSKEIKDKITQIGIAEQKIVVIPNGTDLELFKIPKTKKELREQLNIPQDSFVFVFVGKLNKPKGVNELINTFLRIPNNTYLIVVGSGELLNNFKFIRNVLFTGQVNPKLIPNYLKASDAFVFPSYTEGSPNVMFEAMAAGLPMVITSVGAVPEIITDKENGILITPQNEQELYDGMITLLNSKELVKKMSKNNLEKIKNYTFTKKAERFIKMYSKLSISL